MATIVSHLGQSGLNDHGVTVSIALSDGTDGAVVVLIDTEFEPDGSDDGPGLRVVVNDHDTYVGVAYTPKED